jgi:WD40 repeat protein
MPGVSSPVVAAALQLDDYVSTLGFSADGECLVAGSLAGDAAIVHGARRVGLASHPGGVLCAAWSPAAPVVAVGGADGTLRCSTAEGVAAEPVALGAWVNQVAWRPDGSLLAVAAGRDVAVLGADGAEQDRHRHPSTVTAIAWTPSGMRLAAGCYGGVWWYQPGTDGVHKHFAWKGSVLTLAVSPNTRWIASGNQDNSVHVWRLWNGDDLQMSGYEAKVEHLAWDRSSRWLCVAGIGEVTLWDFSGRGPQGSRPKTLDGHTRRVTALAFSGTTLASGSADGTIRLWSVPKKKPVAVIDVEDEITRLAWHPRGGVLAVGTASGTVLRVTPER